MALERGNLDEEVSSLSLAESKQFLFCFLLFVFRTGDESEVTVKVSVVSKDAAEKLPPVTSEDPSRTDPPGLVL